MKKLIALMAAALLLVTATVPALADNFTDSVGVKPALEIIGEEEGGVLYVGQLIDAKDPSKGYTVVKKIVDADLLVTAYGERNDSFDDRPAEKQKEIKDNLDKAYKEIQEAPTLGRLNKDLIKIAQSIDSKYNTTVFVASDLFDLSVINGIDEMLMDENHYVRVRFRTSLSDKPVLMIRNARTNKWETVDDRLVTLEKDGTLTVFFRDLGAVALLKINPNRLDLSKMGDTTHLTLWIVLASVAVVGAGAAFVLLRRRQDSREQ